MADGSTFDSAALRSLFGDLRNVRLLTADEEVELARRIQEGDEDALSRMVLGNARLVVKLARPYRNPAVPFEDLVGEGLLGLIEAARRFDPERGNRFVTFAVWWIRKALLTSLTEQSRQVRVPAFQARREREIRAAERRLSETLGRSPEREEIADLLDAPLAAVDRILARNPSEFSLNQVRGESEDLEWGERLQAGAGDDPERALIDQEALAMLVAAIAELPERERRVIRRRFGIDGESPEALRQLGETLGLSRERVRQIEGQARMRLRRILLRRRRRRVAPGASAVGENRRPAARKPNVFVDDSAASTPAAG